MIMSRTKKVCQVFQLKKKLCGTKVCATFFNWKKVKLCFLVLKNIQCLVWYFSTRSLAQLLCFTKVSLKFFIHPLFLFSKNIVFSSGLQALYSAFPISAHFLASSEPSFMVYLNQFFKVLSDFCSSVEPLDDSAAFCASLSTVLAASAVFWVFVPLGAIVEKSSRECIEEIEVCASNDFWAKHDYFLSCCIFCLRLLSQTENSQNHIISMQWHVCSTACRDHHLPEGGCDLQFIFSFVTMSREHRMVLTLTCCLSNMLHCIMILWAIVKLSNDIMTQLTRLPQHYCNIRVCPENWSMHDMACMIFYYFMFSTLLFHS